MLTGAADVTGTLKRTTGDFDLNNLTLDGSVVLDGGRVEGIELQKAVVKGRLARRHLNCSSSRSRVPPPGDSQRRSGARRYDAVEPDLSVETPQLAALKNVLGDVQDHITLDGQVTGTNRLRVDGTLSGSDVAYGGVAATPLPAGEAAVWSVLGLGIRARVRVR
jgi:hypothetical protein